MKYRLRHYVGAALVIALGVSVLVFSKRAVVAHQNHKGLVRIGWVGNSQLSDLAPPELRKPCFWMSHRDGSASVSSVDRALALHPNSFLTYLGRLQLHLDILPSELQAAQAQYDQNPSAENAFHLGVSECYTWEAEENLQNKTHLVNARRLLGFAWSRTKQPIAGLMLCEAYNNNPVLGVKELGAVDTNAIHEEILQTAIGADAFRQYKQAAADQFRTAPPPAVHVPIASRSLALGIVASLRSEASRRWEPCQLVNGSWQSQDKPLTKTEQQQAIYYKTWFDDLVAHTPNA